MTIPKGKITHEEALAYLDLISAYFGYLGLDRRELARSMLTAVRRRLILLEGQVQSSTGTLPAGEAGEG